MPEPTSSTATAIAAAASGVTLALFGVDYFSLLYGLVGAMVAVVNTAQMPWVKAVVFVVLSTLIGAVLGNAAVVVLGTTNRIMLILGCLIGGAGAFGLVAALIKIATGRLDRLSGEQAP